jgi:hypothetical protein
MPGRCKLSHAANGARHWRSVLRLQKMLDAQGADLRLWMARRAGTAAAARRRAALDGWGAEIPKQGVFANNRIAINNRDPN